MTTNSMVKNAREEYIGQLLYHLDPDKKNKQKTAGLEKIKLEIIKCYIIFNKTCMNI